LIGWVTIQKIYIKKRGGLESMKNLKRFYAVAIALTMLVSLLVPVTAASDYSTEAEALYALGLYKGISTEPGVFNPDLDSTLNRQTAATMVLRLFGLEDEALFMDEMEARDILEAKFKDAASVDGWAVKQVAYAVEADIIKGFPDGTFAPKGLLTGKQYCTLLLKMLGYNDFTFDAAGQKFAEVAGLNISDEMAFSTNSSIPKSVLVGASYSALKAMPEGSTSTLAEELVKDGIIDASVAEQYGLVTPVGPTATPTVVPSEEPTETPDPNVTPDPNATATATPPVSYDSDVVIEANTSPTVMAQNVTDFNIMNFKVTNNNASAVTFTQFTIEMDRFLGVNTKVADIKLWEGTDRKSPGTAMWTGSTYSAVINLTRPLTIEPGKSVNYKVTADIGNGGGAAGSATGPAALGEQYKFTITNMTFGGSPVKGLPLMGNAIQVSTVASNNTVSITDESVVASSTNFAIGGRGIEVGKFKLSAPNDEKVTVNSIKIANAGAGISTGEIESVEIYNGATLLGSAEVDRDIEFETPIEIPASGSVILTIKINSTIDIDNTDTFRAQIADAKDIDAVGDLFGSSLDLDIVAPLNFTNTYTAAKAVLSVTGIQTAQSTTALETAKNFKLGTIFVKNNNVEDVRLSTLKVNIVPSGALNTNGNTIKNLRLIAPDGTTVLDSVTNLDSKPGAGANAFGANDWVVTFSLANEYTIAKNTEIGFQVIADILDNGDDTKTVTLSFYQTGVTTSLSHLLAVGQSSGEQLTAQNGAAGQPPVPVLANAVTITAATGQNVIITEDSDWDVAPGTIVAAGDGVEDVIAAGDNRVVANWKIADSTLSEDAEVTEIKLTNTVGAAVEPETYHFSNFELYHDGVKVATSATMSADNTVTFGDGETPMFTVTDGDTSGKTLVIKADISDDVTKDDQLDLQLVAVGDLKAKGASTGQPIDASVTVDLGNNKVLKQSYVMVTEEEGVATNVSASNSTELLRFTVTPKNGETVDLSDLSFVITDALQSTATETISIYNVTDVAGVTLAGASATAFNTKNDITVIFNEGTLSTVSEAKTFSLRANTFTNGGTFQVGIKYTGDMLQIIAPTQDGTTEGFAALGDKIVGPSVTAAK
jgi:hypothetical protein